MSTISQTPKVNTVRTLNLRNMNLPIAAALILVVAAIFAVTLAPAAKPIDHSAYMLYRQGEWLSVPIRVSNAEAYQIFRQAEVSSPVSNAEAYKIFRQGEVASAPILTNAEAYQIFRLGEWASVNTPETSSLDLTAYHLSERTLVDAEAGLAGYLLSEHTLVDPHAGMAAFLNSERTMIPVTFNQYQLSEWFGQ